MLNFTKKRLFIAIAALVLILIFWVYHDRGTQPTTLMTAEVRQGAIENVIAATGKWMPSSA